MILGSNVRVWTARPGFNASTKGTSPSQTYLSDVLGRMRALPANQYLKIPPELANKAIYELCVDVDIDIVDADRLTAVQDFDGFTWPRHLAGITGYSWVVRYIDPDSPLILPERCLYVELVRAVAKTHR